MFRQDPGGDLNSMGFVRINIPNPHGVYMHDTPSKGIFGDDFRFVSSGCVRVQNVRDYIQWLLKDTPGWSREQIDADLQGGLAHRRPARPAGQRLLDLHHRLGDPRRPRPVPRRHLQPRRLRQRDPGGEPGADGAGRGDVPAELRAPPTTLEERPACPAISVAQRLCLAGCRRAGQVSTQGSWCRADLAPRSLASSVRPC